MSSSLFVNMYSIINLNFLQIASRSGPVDLDESNDRLMSSHVLPTDVDDDSLLEVVSSQTITSQSRTVETTTYTAERVNFYFLIRGPLPWLPKQFDTIPNQYYQQLLKVCIKFRKQWQPCSFFKASLQFFQGTSVEKYLSRRYRKDGACFH